MIIDAILKPIKISADPLSGTVLTTLYAIAVDGPNMGSMVQIPAIYNSSTGNYELATAGSGGGVVTYSYLTMEDDSYLLQETGDKIIL